MKTLLDVASALAATAAAFAMAVHLGEFSADQASRGRNRNYRGSMLAFAAFSAAFACCRIAGCCLSR